MFKHQFFKTEEYPQTSDLREFIDICEEICLSNSYEEAPAVFDVPSYACAVAASVTCLIQTSARPLPSILHHTPEAMKPECVFMT
ncbi:hypothetical protein CEXT_167851 [Caerostris extrusa]|uniref:Uncharacterized protein n=1 Tax=Caerostris extrusa TaxID=172846 RepID=A0AAV4N191_CAEEX|nr:hypothetical protein CEXT_167851 [Caerostris extrusa]